MSNKRIQNMLIRRRVSTFILTTTIPVEEELALQIPPCLRVSGPVSFVHFTVRQHNCMQDVNSVQQYSILVSIVSSAACD